MPKGIGLLWIPYRSNPNYLRRIGEHLDLDLEVVAIQTEAQNHPYMARHPARGQTKHVLAGMGGVTPSIGQPSAVQRQWMGAQHEIETQPP